MHNNLLSAFRQFKETSSLVAATTIPSDLTPLDRFQMICDREKIRVVEQPFSFKGLYTSYKNRDFILLDSRMTMQEREFVAFHELGHYFHDHACFADSPAAQEFEANFFAYLSLRPSEVRK